LRITFKEIGSDWKYDERLGNATVSWRVDMDYLSVSESKFLSDGGVLWCTRILSNSTWQIYKLMSSGEDIFEIQPESKERAEEWLFVLAELSINSAEANVHHSVPRLTARDLTTFPPLL
jgi:hypothetical protein